ncbi:MAG: hypothetical protein ACP6IU_14725 [Candidatus Asgardarchaeia archaeon]
MKSITIRGVDERLYREFKIEAVKQGLKIGEALNEAIRYWLKQKRKMRKKVSKRDPLWDIIEHPIDWGAETDASRVDKELYGDDTEQ